MEGTQVGDSLQHMFWRVAYMVPEESPSLLWSHSSQVHSLAFTMYMDAPPPTQHKPTHTILSPHHYPLPPIAPHTLIQLYRQFPSWGNPRPDAALLHKVESVAKSLLGKQFWIHSRFPYRWENLAINTEMSQERLKQWWNVESVKKWFGHTEILNFQDKLNSRKPLVSQLKLQQSPGLHWGQSSG